MFRMGKAIKIWVLLEQKNLKSFKTGAAALCKDEEFGKLDQPSPVWKGVLECGRAGSKQLGFGSSGLHGLACVGEQPCARQSQLLPVGLATGDTNSLHTKFQLIKGVYGASAQVYFRKGSNY